MITQRKVIELAIEKTGGIDKLAKKLSVSDSFIRRIKTNNDPIPYKKIKLLAKITEPEITEQQIFDLRTK
jgi:hypothetical protein